MSLTSDLRVFLLSDAEIAVAIADRIHIAILPQAPMLPAVTWQVVSTRRGHTMQGPDGLAATRLQVDAWAKTYTDARSLADAIRIRLDGTEGSLGPGPTIVQQIFFREERTTLEKDSSGAGSVVVELHRISADYEIWHEDA